MDNIVKCNIYLTDMGDFGPMNEVYTTFFSDPMPVSGDPLLYSGIYSQIGLC